MSQSLPRGLSSTTLAILAGLGATPLSVRGGGVTGTEKAATPSPKPVTCDNSIKSMAYGHAVTCVHVLPVSDRVSDIWEERAAVFEYEGGHPRDLAEAMASLLLSSKQMDGSGAEMCALDRELTEMVRRHT